MFFNICLTITVFLLLTLPIGIVQALEVSEWGYTKPKTRLEQLGRVHPIYFIALWLTAKI